MAKNKLKALFSLGFAICNNSLGFANANDKDVCDSKSDVDGKDHKQACARFCVDQYDPNDKNPSASLTDACAVAKADCETDQTMVFDKEGASSDSKTGRGCRKIGDKDICWHQGDIFVSAQVSCKKYCVGNKNVILNESQESHSPSLVYACGVAKASCESDITKIWDIAAVSGCRKKTDEELCAGKNDANDFKQACARFCVANKNDDSPSASLTAACAVATADCESDITKIWDIASDSGCRKKNDEELCAGKNDANSYKEACARFCLDKSAPPSASLTNACAVATADCEEDITKIFDIDGIDGKKSGCRIRDDNELCAGKADPKYKEACARFCLDTYKNDPNNKTRSPGFTTACAVTAADCEADTAKIWDLESENIESDNGCRDKTQDDKNQDLAQKCLDEGSTVAQELSKLSAEVQEACAVAEERCERAEPEGEKMWDFVAAKNKDGSADAHGCRDKTDKDFCAGKHATKDFENACARYCLDKSDPNVSTNLIPASLTNACAVAEGVCEKDNTNIFEKFSGPGNGCRKKTDEELCATKADNYKQVCLKFCLDNKNVPMHTRSASLTNACAVADADCESDITKIFDNSYGCRKKTDGELCTGQNDANNYKQACLRFCLDEKNQPKQKNQAPSASLTNACAVAEVDCKSGEKKIWDVEAGCRDEHDGDYCLEKNIPEEDDQAKSFEEVCGRFCRASSDEDGKPNFAAFPKLKTKKSLNLLTNACAVAKEKCETEDKTKVWSPVSGCVDKSDETKCLWADDFDACERDCKPKVDTKPYFGLVNPKTIKSCVKAEELCLDQAKKEEKKEYLLPDGCVSQNQKYVISVPFHLAVSGCNVDSMKEYKTGKKGYNSMKEQQCGKMIAARMRESYQPHVGFMDPDAENMDAEKQKAQKLAVTSWGKVLKNFVSVFVKSEYHEEAANAVLVTSIRYEKNAMKKMRKEFEKRKYDEKFENFEKNNFEKNAEKGEKFEKGKSLQDFELYDILKGEEMFDNHNTALLHKNGTHIYEGVKHIYEKKSRKARIRNFFRSEKKNVGDDEKAMMTGVRIWFEVRDFKYLKTAEDLEDDYSGSFLSQIQKNPEIYEKKRKNENQKNENLNQLFNFEDSIKELVQNMNSENLKSVDHVYPWTLRSKEIPKNLCPVTEKEQNRHHPVTASSCVWQMSAWWIKGYGKYEKYKKAAGDNGMISKDCGRPYGGMGDWQAKKKCQACVAKKKSLAKNGKTTCENMGRWGGGNEHAYCTFVPLQKGYVPMNEGTGKDEMCFVGEMWNNYHFTPS